MQTMTPYEPLSKSKTDLFASLRSSKMRKRHALFCAEGRKCVADTKAFFRAEAIVGLPQTLRDCGFAPAPGIYSASSEQLHRISSLSTEPDIIAVYHTPHPAEPEIGSGLVLMLDGVQDPGNLGTIIRLAAWFGVKSIIMSADCADPYTPKTVQASMGAIGTVGLSRADLPGCIRRHPEKRVYGMALEGKSIYEAELAEDSFIVMGNEGKGISDTLRKELTDTLLIPPYPAARLGAPDCPDSLNVAMATGITLAQFRAPKTNANG